MERKLSVLSDKEVLEMTQVIRSAENVVICAHRGPDGDAVGSSLGLAGYLESLGKNVEIIFPNPFPDFLRWIPQANRIRFYEQERTESSLIIEKADTIFMLDFSTIDRLKEMGKCVLKSNAAKVVIDHHLNPDKELAPLIISHPRACSTSEIVFRVIYQLEGYGKMTRAQAAAIYTGMMTDTGGFSYNSNSPEIYLIVSLLLEKKIDKDKIYRNVFNNYSEHRLHFVGYVLYDKLKFYAHRRASIMTISREEMKRFHFIRGDGEGLVNLPLQVKGMRLSISLREDTEKDVIRVSLRSVDDFPCNLMAERFFNGGGHLNASGGELPFPLTEAVKVAERAINVFSEYL